MDLNEEAIEICRLSLWIKTAERGKVLTSLDHPIREGNSVVDDATVHPKALDWREAFPEVFAQGGFDVIVANPPYVRQELLSAYKPYFEAKYQAYHGMADLYVYFYELGLRLLKPGGLLSFIVTNKWMKSGYGEPLRRYLSEHAWIQSVVDFGHAKQIFEDADVFPSIIVARKPTDQRKPTTARLCSIPREQLRIEDLTRQIETEGVELPVTQLEVGGWQLEQPVVRQLMRKLKENGKPLLEYVGSAPLFGVKTGFNEAFHIDTVARQRLVNTDPRSVEIIFPYLRGQDIKRWSPSWENFWVIGLKSSYEAKWPWSECDTDAESVFKRTYPAVYSHMKGHEAALKKRTDKGKYWWELRSCAYYAEFARTKICIQRIAYHPRVSIDSGGFLLNDAAIILRSSDLWLLCCLNSPAMWYSTFRTFPHKKDEAIAMDMPFVEQMAIPERARTSREISLVAAQRLIAIADLQFQTRQQLVDWLQVEHEIAKPSKKLQSPTDLDSDAFVAEVKKVRGKKNPLSIAAVNNLREEHVRTIEPARALAAEALTLERQISDLVNEAYGLTPDEIALMWQTAPPRMPFSPVPQL